MTSGTINREKGHHLAIDSLARIKQKVTNVNLMIVGTGESQTTFEKIWKAVLNNNIVLTGFVDNDDIVNVLQ